MDSHTTGVSTGVSTGAKVTIIALVLAVMASCGAGALYMQVAAVSILMQGSQAQASTTCAGINAVPVGYLGPTTPGGGAGGMNLGTAVAGQTPTTASSSGSAPASPPASGKGGDVTSFPGFTPAMLTIAKTAVAVGEQRRIPPQGIVVALAVTAQESMFKNYANDGTGDLRADQRGVVESMKYSHDAVGHDHGSVNPLQQQYPWWGTVEQLMNPAYAYGKFYDALLKVPGWQTLPVTIAAQKVQQSAFPEAYAQHEGLARSLYAALTGTPLPAGIDVLCGTASTTSADCPPSGLPAEEGLTPDALILLRCVHHQFPQIKTIYGVGSRPAGTGDDHATGKAVDFMIDDYKTPTGRAFGDQVAAWVQANQARLGVRYIIWNVKIWNIERDAPTAPWASWRAYHYPGAAALDDTTLHKDHVHVSVYGNKAQLPASAAGGAVSVAGWASPMAPGSYQFTSPFGWRVQPITGKQEMHPGQDMAGPSGTPIVSASGGTVTFAGVRGGYGNMVIVDAGGGIEVLYGHMSSIATTVGATVQPGAPIGTRGSTGLSTGPHLHFEIRQNGSPIDPVAWMAAHGVDLAAGAQK